LLHIQVIYLFLSQEKLKRKQMAKGFLTGRITVSKYY